MLLSRVRPLNARAGGTEPQARGTPRGLQPGRERPCLRRPARTSATLHAAPGGRLRRARHRRTIAWLPTPTFARLLSRGRRVGPIARHLHPRGHAAACRESIRHRFAIVCLTRPQSHPKCGNPREQGDVGRARDSAANRAHSPAEGRRLKIVVSPVRVRVSPYGKGPAIRGFLLRRAIRRRPPRGSSSCRRFHTALILHAVAKKGEIRPQATR